MRCDDYAHLALLISCNISSSPTPWRCGVVCVLQTTGGDVACPFLLSLNCHVNDVAVAVMGLVVSYALRVESKMKLMYVPE